MLGRAYTTGFMLMGHTVAKDDEAFIALFSGASSALRDKSTTPPSFHLPVATHPELCRWCLSVGLRIVSRCHRLIRCANWGLVGGTVPSLVSTRTDGFPSIPEKSFASLSRRTFEMHPTL
ncbi:hypothetical protein KFL_002810030 [Klebsormidium nitens]|uniref:Uncharacterized protein n=1 Tax=Klebsormidium nitens TaxID=105231 RepID=A0A1Y1I5Q8_KLENI|nr:hypothetical protein KFL_002810030 [Klebsormidium nitens]|eukprot:GAQ86294.1 hypothetical protein KFL_002810030 [Klebsormidium nitens]